MMCFRNNPGCTCCGNKYCEYAMAGDGSVKWMTRTGSPQPNPPTTWHPDGQGDWFVEVGNGDFWISAEFGSAQRSSLNYCYVIETLSDTEFKLWKAHYSDDTIVSSNSFTLPDMQQPVPQPDPLPPKTYHPSIASANDEFVVIEYPHIIGTLPGGGPDIQRRYAYIPCPEETVGELTAYGCRLPTAAHFGADVALTVINAYDGSACTIYSKVIGSETTVTLEIRDPTYTDNATLLGTVLHSKEITEPTAEVPFLRVVDDDPTFDTGLTPDSMWNREGAVILFGTGDQPPHTPEFYLEGLGGYSFIPPANPSDGVGPVATGALTPSGRGVLGHRGEQGTAHVDMSVHMLALPDDEEVSHLQKDFTVITANPFWQYAPNGDSYEYIINIVMRANAVDNGIWWLFRAFEIEDKNIGTDTGYPPPPPYGVPPGNSGSGIPPTFAPNARNPFWFNWELTACRWEGEPGGSSKPKRVWKSDALNIRPLPEVV